MPLFSDFGKQGDSILKCCRFPCSNILWSISPEVGLATWPLPSSHLAGVSRVSVAAGMPNYPTADFFPKDLWTFCLLSPHYEDRPLYGFGDATGSMGAEDVRESSRQGASWGHGMRGSGLCVEYYSVSESIPAGFLDLPSESTFLADPQADRGKLSNSINFWVILQGFFPQRDLHMNVSNKHGI